MTIDEETWRLGIKLLNAKYESEAKQRAQVVESRQRQYQRLRTWLELAEDFFTTAYQAREMLNSDDLEAKRKAVAKIGWNLMLKDEKLVWMYQKPYDILLKPKYRSDLRRR